MEFSINGAAPEQQAVSTIVVGLYADAPLARLDRYGLALDQQSKGALSGWIKAGDADGKIGTTLILRDVQGIVARRIVIVGLGKEDEMSPATWRKAVTAAIKAITGAGGGDALLCLTGLTNGQTDLVWRIKQAVLLTENSLYRFDLKSRHEEHELTLKHLALVAPPTERAAAQKALTQARAIAEGMIFMRNLANQPPNVCNPRYLAHQAKMLAKSHKNLAVKVLDREAMKKLGMNTLLAVARGSAQPPQFIILKYSGAAPSVRPVVLVGKGVTFDTGGISLKPAGEMDEMKFDMSGAASVLGVMKTVALLGLPINVVGLAPAVENMPGGNASRPGDIVTSMSGQTVEILNTDAEGRLILCDALTYAERFDPDCVIDIATLTGACVIALGHVVSGLLTNHEPLAQALLDCGVRIGDRAWQMPMLDEYQDILKSNFADIPNIGNRTAGTITAACFLSRFTKKYHWAHLDVAGTAYQGGTDKGSTGRPVPLLVQFLLDRADEQSAPARKRRKTTIGER